MNLDEIYLSVNMLILIKSYYVNKYYLQNMDKSIPKFCTHPLLGILGTLSSV